ncbi:DUF202 domain-containing protein [Tessaracoccus antarcticus]|uniref:DUF202 domain-containing protein n=1 Tax=Tessaracoccus antarcticus TaxID=2479848 RepID=A0A3M0G868_9ACTN|nr:DUF202 domain-containing protein [Tessaracoccus antarcticus]RMB61155.1 DUF202 domain-containing protein [Tessaracoccus antarcticus]
MSNRPFDPGLQPERSALAWQRTALSIAVGSLIFGRILATPMGLWTLLPMAAGLALSGILGLKGNHRYAHHHRTLTSGNGLLADGRLNAALALFVLGAGLLSLVVVILWRLQGHPPGLE